MGEDPETSRRLGDLIRWGAVHSVDLDAKRCVVESDGALSGPLPWLTGAAGAMRIWAPPTVGEQVMLLCPEGDLAAAVALKGVFSTTFPSPSDQELLLVDFDDGAVLTYRPATHELRVALPAGGSVVLVAPAGVEIEGDLSVSGNVAVGGGVQVDEDLQVSGEAIVSGDVTGDGKSLSTHRHTAVMAGGGISGPPQ